MRLTMHELRMTLRLMGVLGGFAITSLLIASACQSSLCSGHLFCRASATLRATPELIARQPQTGLPMPERLLGGPGSGAPSPASPFY